MIYFPCSSCRYEISAPEDTVGTFMLCPSCFARQRIPPPVTNEKIEEAQATGQIYELRTGEKIREYKETIPVYCQLCRTLMYGSVERIGSYLSCPDCGTKTQIRPLLEEKRKEKGDRRQETKDRRHGTGDRRQGAGDRRQETDRRQGDRRSETGGEKQKLGVPSAHPSIVPVASLLSSDSSNPNVRYGIYGGAFDPIHLGHLLLAEYCLRQAKLDRVIFVPTGTSPHRSGKESYRASAEDRLGMIESAIVGCDEFLVSRYEVDQQKTSYTVETLQYFQRTFTLVEPKFFLLMGADMFNDLPNWREAGEICKLALPLVVTRPESPPPYFAALGGIVSADRLDEIRQSAVVMPQVGISSTQIRSRIAAGQSVRFQVPRSVESYIASRRLYRQG